MQDMRCWALRLCLSCFLFLHSSSGFSAQDFGEFREVTSSLQVGVSGFRRDMKTGALAQAVTVTNGSTRSIPGTVYLVLSGLNPEVAVTSESKKTIIGGMTAFALITSSGGRSGLQPGERVSTVLRFEGSDKTQIRYEPRIFQKNNN